MGKSQFREMNIYIYVACVFLIYFVISAFLKLRSVLSAAVRNSLVVSPF